MTPFNIMDIGSWKLLNRLGIYNHDLNCIECATNSSNIQTQSSSCDDAEKKNAKKNEKTMNDETITTMKTTNSSSQSAFTYFIDCKSIKVKFIKTAKQQYLKILSKFIKIHKFRRFHMHPRLGVYVYKK